MMGWVGMGRSIRSKLFLLMTFNMDHSICIGTAIELERFNASTEGKHWRRKSLAFNIPRCLKKALIEELLEYRSSTSNPR